MIECSPPLVMSHTDRIQQLLLEKPGLKAQQIAGELGLERSEVAAALHSTRGRRLHPGQHLSLVAESGRRRGSHAGLAQPDRQTLPVLSGVPGAGKRTGSQPARRRGDVDYVVLDRLPFAASAAGAGRSRRQKAAAEGAAGARAALALYRLRDSPAVRRRMRTRRDADRAGAALSDRGDAGRSPAELLRPASGIPLFNLEVLKSLLAVDSGNVIDEAIHLSEELGLANSEEDLPAVGRDHPAPAALPSGVGLAGGPQSVRALARAFRSPN